MSGREDDISILSFCHVCGFPESAAPLVRLTWEDQSTKSRFRMRMAVPEKSDLTDALVCLECVREIKRLPFSEIERGTKLPPPESRPRLRIADEGEELDIPF